MSSFGIPILGIVGRGHGYFAKVSAVKTELEREPISVNPVARSGADLLPILGGTPIAAEPTD